MKISAKTIVVEMKDREGNVETKTFSKEKPRDNTARELVEAEIIDMTYGSGKGIDALHVKYWEEEAGVRKVINELFPLEYTLIHVKGGRW